MGLVETYVKEHPWISGIAAAVTLGGALAMPSAVRRIGSYLSDDVVIPEPKSSSYVGEKPKAEKQYPNTREGRLERFRDKFLEIRDNFVEKTENDTFEYLSDTQEAYDKSEEDLRQQIESRAAEILNPERRGYLDNSKGLIEDRLGQKEE